MKVYIVYYGTQGSGQVEVEEIFSTCEKAEKYKAQLELSAQGVWEYSVEEHEVK